MKHFAREGAGMLKRFLLLVPIVLALSSFDAVAKPKPDKGGGGPSPISAPEFDAKTAGAAVALLVGGVAVLSARLRRRR